MAQHAEPEQFCTGAPAAAPDDWRGCSNSDDYSQASQLRTGLGDGALGVSKKNISIYAVSNILLAFIYWLHVFQGMGYLCEYLVTSRTCTRVAQIYYHSFC